MCITLPHPTQQSMDTLNSIIRSPKRFMDLRTKMFTERLGQGQGCKGNYMDANSP